MEKIINLVIEGERITVTSLTPLVVMIRDILYEGDWELMLEDLKNNDLIKAEIEKCKKIENKVVILDEQVYAPTLFPEFKEWITEVGLKISDFKHVSLNGLYDLALDYADRNLYDVSMNIIKFMLEIDKNYAPAYELMGSLLLEQGKMEEGLRYLDKALEIDPWLVQAYSSLGEAYYNLGDYEKAAYYWEREIEYSPNNKLTYFMLADAYKKLKRFDLAIQCLNKLLERDENNILAMYELMEIYKNLGENEKAQMMEEKILHSTPKYLTDMEVWARILLKHGKYEKVIEILEEALKSTKLNAHIKLLLIIPYLKLGKVEKAKELFEDIKNNNIWYYYGKQELFDEYLTEEEKEICGIS